MDMATSHDCLSEAGRAFKKAGLKPHRNRDWLTPSLMPGSTGRAPAG